MKSIIYVDTDLESFERSPSMKILHYTLGFSPYRSGGLTKYAYDLMQTQCKLGHQVTALYPGGTSLFRKKCHVRRDTSFSGMLVYEMSNPLPVPLMYGVKDTETMMDETGLDVKTFEKMLDIVRPNVFHIHTLMGIPKAYIQIVHNRYIRIVYTSHDYFGLCLKVNFINSKEDLCQLKCARQCEECNQNAKPAYFLKMRNSKRLVPFKSIVRRILK